MDNLEQYLSYCKKVRHLLHQYPELGFSLPKTIEIIKEELDKMNAEYEYLVGSSSIVCQLGKGDVTIGIRADIDALPIREENKTSYCSKIPNQMHACGHDVHTALLLTLIKYYAENQEQLHGKLKCIFQASEEGPASGGKLVASDSSLDDVDVFLAYHVNPGLETGVIGLKYRELNASCDDFIITMIGSAGHAAYSHQAIDPIQMATEVYQMIQNIKSRELSPTQKVAISICSFHAGSANNVIPEYAKLEGTIRTYDIKTKETIKEKIEKIVKGVAEIHNGSYQLEINEGCVPLINDEKIANIIEQALIKENIKYRCDLEATMGVDDFAYYLQTKPGVMLMLGVRSEEKGIIYPLHNGKFDIDEDCYEDGIKSYIAILKAIHNTFKK